MECSSSEWQYAQEALEMTIEDDYDEDREYEKIEGGE